MSSDPMQNLVAIFLHWQKTSHTPRNVDWCERTWCSIVLTNIHYFKKTVQKSLKYLTKHFVIGGGFSLNKAEYTSGSFEGNEVPGAPEETATFYLDYSITDSINLYFDAVYTGNRFPESDDANSSSKLGGYTLTNANVSWGKENWDIGFRINNLGNKQYSAFLFSSGGYPSPERNVELSISYQMY